MLSDAVAFLTKYDSFLLMAHVAPDGVTKYSQARLSLWYSSQ